MVGIKKMGLTISKHARKLGSRSKIIMIKNPRTEKEKHKMQMENRNFLSLLKSKPKYFSEESKIMIKSLNPYKQIIKKYKKSFI